MKGFRAHTFPRLKDDVTTLTKTPLSSLLWLTSPTLHTPAHGQWLPPQAAVAITNNATNVLPLVVLPLLNAGFSSGDNA